MNLREAARRALHEWKTDPGSVRMASLMMALQDALAGPDEVAAERKPCAQVCELVVRELDDLKALIAKATQTRGNNA